jgi:hypothetical protein
MTALEGIASSAITAFVRSGAAVTIASSADRMAKAGLCAVVAGVLATASIGCALAALWIWEIPRLGAAGAPLLVAAILLVGGLATLAAMRLVMRPRPAPPPAFAAPELLLAEAMRLFRDRKGAVLLAAIIAGLMAGRSEK